MHLCFNIEEEISEACSMIGYNWSEGGNYPDRDEIVSSNVTNLLKMESASRVQDNPVYRSVIDNVEKLQGYLSSIVDYAADNPKDERIASKISEYGRALDFAANEWKVIGKEADEKYPKSSDFLESREDWFYFWIGKNYLEVKQYTIVLLESWMLQGAEEQGTAVKLPTELDTATVKAVLQKAVDAGLLDNDYQPIEMTGAQKRLFAKLTAIMERDEKGKKKYMISVYESFWNVKRLSAFDYSSTSKEHLDDIKRLFPSWVVSHFKG